MRKLLFTMGLLLMFSMSAFAQTTQNVVSDSLIGVPTQYVSEQKATKNAFFINASTWANRIEPGKKISVEMEDKESGTLILKATCRLSSKVSGMNQYSNVDVSMNIKIDCRENKYRATYSNFAAKMSPDRTISAQYLSTSSLKAMIDELERIEDLATYDFKRQTSWSYDAIVDVRNKYLDKVNVYKAQAQQVDTTNRKGKKEVERLNKWAKDESKNIKYLDFILKSFGDVVTELNNSLSETMKTTDNF